ncbi:MAG: LysR family transcriptional regulator [Boseongicola sp. SB0664_bin_43]|uniref:LysR family transcriptional regulator n=1 Tax=Boseongicola sp. SB0664_bin_43 TaxID=2604844 RepID=A0A6B0Y0F0_9RHOB|nr:LysR family transcriptional regulator [Boseongicola sp. SB0664_bin_43]MYK32150.1 LysR family transcriptional regulator [Boseongicola sp. SB0670_bin_30]
MSNVPLPPLNSLQAFEAAGRHESFLHAAVELQVSPGAVSRHVRLLERFLGTELFVRQSNGVTLTADGNRYARKVSRIVRDLRRATADVRKPNADAGT